MKKFFPFLWVFIALSLFVFLFFGAIYYFSKTNMPTFKIIFVSLLISILILIILRKFILPLSNYLLKIFISILSGTFFALILLLLSNGLKFSHIATKLSVAFLLGFFVSYLFSIKKTIRGLYFILILLILGIVIGIIISEKQKYIVKKYEKEFQNIGFSFELKEIFPLKYSKPQCDGFFEKIKVFSDEKNEKWKDFFNKFVMPYHEENFLKFLKEGENPRDFIISDEKNKDKIWDEFFILNEEIKKEGEKCTHIQWFEPEEYKDKLWNAPLPPFLPFMRFSRILETASIIMKAMGKEEESEGLLKELYETKEKIKTRGQPLTNTLFRIVMEKVYLLGEAFSLSMEKNLSPEKISRIEKISRDDLSCLISSFNLEFYSYFLFLSNPKTKDFFSQYYSIKNYKFLKYIPKFVLRAFLYRETKNYLFNIYNFFEKLKKVQVEENKFNWTEIKNLKILPSYFYSNPLNTYARNLISIAQARTLLLSEKILELYFQNNALPENIDTLEGTDYIDPFSEKKLIYKKIDEKKFAVYSVGWDGKDDGGKDLYISGAIKIDKINQDAGFLFSVK